MLGFPFLIFICVVIRSSCFPTGGSESNPLKNGEGPQNHPSPQTQIISVEPSSDPVIYDSNLELTCYAKTNEKIVWRWYRVEEGGAEKDQDGRLPKFDNLTLKWSRIRLSPVNEQNKDESDLLDRNYTCKVFKEGNMESPLDSRTFKVVKGQHPEWSWLQGSTTLVIFVAVISLVAGLLLVFYRRRQRHSQIDKELIVAFFRGNGSTSGPALDQDEEDEAVELQEREGTEPYTNMSYDRSNEIKKSDLRLGRLVRDGYFFEARVGTLLNRRNGSHTTVLVKSPRKKKDNPEMSEIDRDSAFGKFLQEIKLSAYVGQHENIVSYVGAVTKNIALHKASLVLEYCNAGDLLSCLHKHRDGNSIQDDFGNKGLPLLPSSQQSVVLKLSTLLRWSDEIASGMEYIQSKRLVHKNLAARNVLLAYRDGVNSDADDCSDLNPAHFIPKISNFGMARNKPMKQPIQWMSIETLESSRFSTETDVWSFGITLWEIFTLGEHPYEGVINAEDNEALQRNQLIAHLNAGNRLLEPGHLPFPELYAFMKRCWEMDPSERPAFNQFIC